MIVSVLNVSHIQLYMCADQRDCIENNCQGNCSGYVTEVSVMFWQGKEG